MSSPKLATVQGFDVAAVINLIVHTSPKESVQVRDCKQICAKLNEYPNTVIFTGAN